MSKITTLLAIFLGLTLSACGNKSDDCAPATTSEGITAPAAIEGAADAATPEAAVPAATPEAAVPAATPEAAVPAATVAPAATEEKPKTETK